MRWDAQATDTDARQEGRPVANEGHIATDVDAYAGPVSRIESFQYLEKRY
jgi:hypothetical protein